MDKKFIQIERWLGRDGELFEGNIFHRMKMAVVRGLHTDGYRVGLWLLYISYAIYSFYEPPKFMGLLSGNVAIGCIIYTEMIIAGILILIGIFAQNYPTQLFGMIVVLIMFLTMSVMGAEANSFDNADFRSILLMAMIGRDIVALRHRYRSRKDIADELTNVITEIAEAPKPSDTDTV